MVQEAAVVDLLQQVLVVEAVAVDLEVLQVFHAPVAPVEVV